MKPICAWGVLSWDRHRLGYGWGDGDRFSGQVFKSKRAALAFRNAKPVGLCDITGKRAKVVRLEIREAQR